ncbi:Transposon Ty3-I Gag-Pol polyprotein [Melia azedarach]|uniref:Transposon Ty3-I Gag-Pol polyprotein n=1 Tax=Melia azedarach TaxID=155640 RepID=A0ACC1XQE1_MELAZ|nr:Transposon Ty3-I Gag-Pol polyprotein [Melia azedarach]
MLQAMDRKYGEMLDRMERLEVSITIEQPSNAPNPTMQARRVPRRVQVDDDFDDGESLCDNGEKKRELYNQLQNLTQGSKSVEDYYKEMEPYMEVEDLLHLALKVEKQLKKRGSTNSFFSYTSSFKSYWRKDDKASSSKPKTESKEAPKTSNPSKDKGKLDYTFNTRNIKCFKCQGVRHYKRDYPNQRNIFMLDGEYYSASEEENGEEMMPPLEDASDKEGDEQLTMAENGKALVARRVLNIHVQQEECDQRENLFHTRCLVKDRVCDVIIDGGSVTNVASTTLVEKLGLPTLKHPYAYKLKWLNDCGEIKVTKQVFVAFKIGKYRYELLFDVVPMHVGHLLLERPWQFDRRVLYNGYTNHYTFENDGKKITLVPLSPKEVYEGELK